MKRKIYDQLHKELPGMKGFPELSIKKMRQFYEEWKWWDNNSILHLNLFRTFRVFMTDASQKRKDNEYRKQHHDERTR